MTDDEKIIDFLERLQKLSSETGVYLSEFGDPFYNPTLEIVGCEEFYSVSLDDEMKYEVRKKVPLWGRASKMISKSIIKMLKEDLQSCEEELAYYNENISTLKNRIDELKSLIEVLETEEKDERH